MLEGNFVDPYDMHSLSLALYRVVIKFGYECIAEGDRYKVSWEALLRHRATGELLTLGDWKGAFQASAALREDPPKLAWRIGRVQRRGGSDDTARSSAPAGQLRRRCRRHCRLSHLLSILSCSFRSRLCRIT